MKIKNMKYLFLLMMAVFALASCSEDDTTTSEYDNWQQRNEQAFSDTLAYAKQQIAAGNTDWKVLLQWSLQDQTPYISGTSLTYNNTDYIVVHELEKGEGVTSPMYTDSVQVAYRGRLLPTTSYPEGYVFDKTFTGTYDKETARVSEFAVSGLVDGFTTALLSMHPGDHWMIYIPYQLGYGTTTSSSTSIPAYSMLRFEVVLKNYRHPDEKTYISRAN